MAKIWRDGGEFGDTIFWDTDPYGLIICYTSQGDVTPRSGNYFYRAYSATGSHTAWKLFFANLTEFYLRICIHGSSFGGEWGWCGGGILLGHVNWDVYGRPCIYDGDNNLIVSGIHPRDNGWNCYELHVKIANSGGRFELKQNGLMEIDFTGDTQPGAITFVDSLLVSCGTSSTLYIDDLALNDTTGGVDDSWCSDGHIERLNPDEDGDLNEWIGSDGNQIDNYLLVDERPPNGDTDNVYSYTPGDQDMYNLSDFDPTDKVVTRIWAECRARDANSLSGEIKLGFKTGGVVHLCSTNRILPSVYTKIVGDDALINPETGVAWTETDLDALQFVIECE